MRSVLLPALVLATLCGSLLPTSAEAGSRRRVRRGANPPVAPAGLRSDELVQRVLADTPTGGTAYLPLGAFRTAIVIDRPMRLVGSPAGTTLDAGTLGRPVIEILAGVSDVSIEGVRLERSQLDGLVARGNNDRLVLSRVVFAGHASNGARVAASDGVVVDRCSFEGNAADGLDLAGRNARISRCTFKDGRGAAAVLRGENASLTNCTVDGGAVGIVFAGLRAAASSNAIRGVAVGARFTADADTCTFSRNEVRNSVTAVATELGSIYNVVSQNRILGTSGDAVVLLGTWQTVEGNDLTGLAASGIVANGDSLHIADNRIDRAAGSAVAIAGRGCMIEGNRLVAPAGDGLVLEGDGNVVALNDCTRSGGDAFHVLGDMNRLVSNTATDAGGEGIHLAGDANTLQSDVLLRSASHGIHVALGVGNRAEGNSLRECGGIGFFDEGVGTTLLRNRID